jgi:hypothetical protein
MASTQLVAPQGWVRSSPLLVLSRSSNIFYFRSFR